MILVKLRGGLSNQMFQYAAARRLARRHDTEVRIDKTWFDRIPEDTAVRRYELDLLQITGLEATTWEMIGTEGVRNTPLHQLPVATFRKLRPRYRFVSEAHYHFDPRILELPDNVCLFGYWVSERYFSDIARLIGREFEFRHSPSGKNAALIAQMQAVQSVGVHVRRGDYATNPRIMARFGLCGQAYYSKAARLVKEKIKDPVFYVFSDDVDWASENLNLGGDTVYVDHNRGAASPEDLRLMSRARHNIIANSGFSWWGAWLNRSEDKTVYAPRRWMNDPEFDTSDVIPDGWLTISE